MFSASKTAGPSGYNIANSLRFRSSASAYLSRTPSVAGNRQTWTWSGWVKRGSLNTFQRLFANYTTSPSLLSGWLRFNDTNTLQWVDEATSTYYLVTTQVFRDPSAWYHIVVSVDTTQSVDSNRVKIYVNGLQITSFSTAIYPTQNYTTAINSTLPFYIGQSAANTEYFDGYLADINFIDGQALTPSSFGVIGTLTGVWKPIAYSGSYGTNGFHLNFSNGTSTTTLGYDSSGNGNNWTTNNISLTAGSTYDWMIDSPTKFPGSSYGVGNYAVFNPVNRTAATLSNANLTASVPAVNESVVSSMGMTSGQWYAEFTATTVASFSTVGVCNQSYVAYGNSPGNDSGGNSTGYNNTTGKVRTAVTDTVYGNSYTTGDVIGIAVDITNNKLFFAINGTWQNSGNPVTGTNPATSMALNVGQIFFVAGVSTGSGSGTWTANFGQRPFAYTPPSGYKSLCTYNLPTPTIQNGAGYMAATLYTGTGAAQNISNTNNGVSFQPDFVWQKCRSAAYSHGLNDSVRGAGKFLYSDLTSAEGNYPTDFSGFLSNGFSLGTGTGSVTNANGATYVAWQWKAGGTAVTNTAGSITSSVSANPTAGFSVVTYTGTSANATVGHGLGVAPSMVIVKGRNIANDWVVYHQSIGNTGAVFLDLTNAKSTSINYWNNTSPTASTFSIGIAAGVNNSSSTYVAYCFAAIAGYSAFGSYTGNGSSDGPFVYCGFRPRYLMIKRTDSTGDWNIIDTSRSTYNQTNNVLWANLSNADSAGQGTDILSNGFKLRSTGLVTNASGGTYIYAAFCEVPMNFALAR